MAGSRSNEAWERVLAAIEADAARAAALLLEDDLTGDLDPAANGAPPNQAQPAIPQPTTPHAGTLPTGTVAATGAAVPSAESAAPAQGIPATWRLPGQPPNLAIDLPLPEEMPPIPAELRQRIERLRHRIAVLQRDLSKALAEARLTPRPVRIPAPQSRPGFVDRKL